MKRNPIAASVVLAMSLPFAATYVLAATQTYEGTVSDSMCGKKHMMPGKSDADCTRECVKEGSQYILVTDKATYTLAGKPSQLEPFAGKHVKVQGELNKDTITVSSIK